MPNVDLLLLVESENLHPPEDLIAPLYKKNQRGIPKDLIPKCDRRNFLLSIKSSYYTNMRLLTPSHAKTHCGLDLTQV